MLDPSCSTSGNSTAPHDDPADIAALAENQLAVLKHAMQFPAAEVIVYSTCSICEMENQQITQLICEKAEGKIVSEHLTLPKGEGGTYQDGGYFALIQC